MFVYISTGAGSHNRGCSQLSADSLALKVGGIQKDSEVKKKNQWSYCPSCYPGFLLLKLLLCLSFY